MTDRARAVSCEMRKLKCGSEAGRVRELYQRLFCREPEVEELKLALEFLTKQPAGELSRWDQYAQLLLASNEMMYVD